MKFTLCIQYSIHVYVFHFTEVFNTQFFSSKLFMICGLEWVHITVSSAQIYSQNNLEQYSETLELS